MRKQNLTDFRRRRPPPARPPRPRRRRFTSRLTVNSLNPPDPDLPVETARSAVDAVVDAAVVRVVDVVVPEAVTPLEVDSPDPTPTPTPPTSPTRRPSPPSAPKQ